MTKFESLLSVNALYILEIKKLTLSILWRIEMKPDPHLSSANRNWRLSAKLEEHS